MIRSISCWIVLCAFAQGCGDRSAAQGVAAAGSPAQPTAATMMTTAGSNSAGMAAPAPLATAGASAGLPPSAAGAAAAGRAGGGAGQQAAGQAAPNRPERLPCDVASVVQAQCQSCHGATPRLGAPMSLTSWAHFQQPAASDKNKKVYQLVRARVLDDKNPMPPLSAGKLSASDQALLADWSERAAPALAASAADCPVTPPPTTQPPEQPTNMPADSRCYDLTVHGESSATDQTPFMIPPGQTYNCFYFDAPWTTPTESVAFKSKLDNEKALHHWFLYEMPSKHPNGTVERNCSPLHLDGPQMLAGWAPGGKDMQMPEGVSAEIAAPGTTLMLEWHYFNNTDAPLPDRSTVSVCGVPAGSRPNTASITWLGTEDFGLGMPAHQTTSVTGTCTPARRGMPADAPIHVLYTIPHMHQYGTHMKIDIQRSAGMKVSLFDQPFSEANQSFVETRADVMAGDKLLTTCTYTNSSNTPVGYGGPFDNGEMCYAFVLYYPAHALDDGSRSLLGANNSCL